MKTTTTIISVAFRTPYYNQNRTYAKNADRYAHIVSFNNKEDAKAFIENVINARGFTLKDVYDRCGNTITL